MNDFALMVGGIIGGLLRYVMETFIPSPWDFPLSTLSINLVGAFALGLFCRVADEKLLRPWVRVGFGTGLIGSFTTFSTLCLDTADLLHTSVLLATLYAVISLVGGPVCAFVGHRMPVLIRRRMTRTSSTPEEQYL